MQPIVIFAPEQHNPLIEGIQKSAYVSCKALQQQRQPITVFSQQTYGTPFVGSDYPIEYVFSSKKARLIKYLSWFFGARGVTEKIKALHHRRDDVRSSDMGYFLKSLVASQISKGISPPIFDFDNSTGSIKIIDSTFYFFIKNCNRNEVVEDLSTPEGLDR